MATHAASLDEARDAVWAARDGLPVGYAAFSGVEHFFRLQEQCGIPSEVGLSFLDGVLTDLTTVRIRSRAELTQYSYDSASSLLLMACHLCGTTSPPALAYAIDVGIAMRLSEIARDVMYDAQRNRIYLPAEWIEPTAVVRAANGNQLEQERVYGALLKHLAMAETYYRSSDYGLRHFPLHARVLLLAARRRHEKIGSVVRRHNLDYWNPRPMHHRGLAANFLAAGLSIALKNRFRDVGEPKPHCAYLHASIMDRYGANRGRLSSLHLAYGRRA